MAGALMGPSKRGRSRGRAMMTDINVTPMVDVMLVLLVIFMVTAPLLTSGVQVDLPKTAATPVNGQDEPLVVSINAQGKVFLQETEITLDDLVPKLKAVTAAKPDQRIFVRADSAIAYGQVMTVMGLINQAGFSKVALITKQLDPGTPPKG